MKNLNEVCMIHSMKALGLSISRIARLAGCDRKTVRKYLARGAEEPHGQRRRRRGAGVLSPYEEYLSSRIKSHPGLSGRRLYRDIAEMGYAGGYTTVTNYLRKIRAASPPPFERRFETGPGVQAQVDFAEFKVEFASEPGRVRKIHLFTMVLGHSRWLWGRFCYRQNLPTVLRMHIEAFEAIGGVPHEVLYDRMKTAVVGEHDGEVIYNLSLGSLLRHYDALPRACRPYRAKTKGKVERPYRYIRQDFYLGREFQDLADLNARFGEWLEHIANVRIHGTTRRVPAEVLVEEREFLRPLPAMRHGAAEICIRRVSRDGMVSYEDNFYSVPDGTGRVPVEVHARAYDLSIVAEGCEVARHERLTGKGGRVLDPSHRKAWPRSACDLPDDFETIDAPPLRPLDFYGAVGERLAKEGEL